MQETLAVVGGMLSGLACVWTGHYITCVYYAALHRRMQQEIDRAIKTGNTERLRQLRGVFATPSEN